MREYPQPGTSATPERTPGLPLAPPPNPSTNPGPSENPQPPQPRELPGTDQPPADAPGPGHPAPIADPPPPGEERAAGGTAAR